MKTPPSRIPKKDKSVELPVELMQPRALQKKETAQRLSDPIEERAPQTNQGIQTTADLIDRIRIRAYELYEQRGRETGNEMEDWLRAEAEMMVRQA